MTTRESYTGAHVRSLAPHHAPLRTRRDLDSWDAFYPALKRSQFAQSVFDILFVLFAFLFVSITGIGFAFAAAVCLFVRIP